MEKIDELFNIFADPKKKDIDNHMRRLGISDYTINKDYTVDLNKDVSILVKNIEECPVNFNMAKGNFIWHYSDLKSMKNLPKKVLGNMSIVHNKIKSMEESPTTMVKGIFNCSGNPIKNLKGSPQCYELIAMMCDLNSLEGSPQKIYGSFNVSRNYLTSLKGVPKEIGETFDCSHNKLDTDSEEFNKKLPKFKKCVFSNNNPLENKPLSKVKKVDEEPEKDNQIHINFDNFKKGDTVIYNKPDSKYNGMIGDITEITDMKVSPTSSSYVAFQITFKKDKNLTLERDSIIANIKGDYLEKYVPSLKVGDMVIYKNPNSKYNGYKGKVDSITFEEGGIPLHKIRFEYVENPGIVDIVSDANKNKTYVNVGKIKSEDLEKVVPPKESEKIIIKDPNNNFTVDEEARFYGRKIKLLELKTPTSWVVRYTENGQNVTPFVLDYVMISKEPNINKESFNKGDKIIYLDPGGIYDECKGIVTYVGYGDFSRTVDLSIVDKFGITRNIYTVNINKIEKESNTKTPIIPKKIEPPKRKYALGDKVIYVSKVSDEKNKDLHLCKGVISFVNTLTDGKDTYDVRFKKQNNVPVERNVFYIPVDNIIREINDYKVGDKVLYTNDSDDDFNGKIGIVNKIVNDSYQVIFNDGNTTMTITDITSDMLTKYTKQIGDEVHVNDTVIYTKPDSKYYGCIGTVQEHKIGEDKPFEVEIKSKDNKLVKLKTTDENLEFVPPPRIFKKGDRIRYINSDRPQFDGMIGTVSKVASKGRFEITLKNPNGSMLFLTTDSDNLLLLEEAEDTENLKFGQIVKYINPDSKNNNKIGEYQGTRVKDNKKQHSIKFDEGNMTKTIFFDEGEGEIIPTGEVKKPTTTTSYTTTTSSSPVKKKKKKEVDPEKPPIMVYNRRNVARKAYKKPGEMGEKKEEVKDDVLRVGDTAKVLDSATKNYIGEIGEIVGITGDKRYIIRFGNTSLYLLRDQLEKIS